MLKKRNRLKTKEVEAIFNLKPKKCFTKDLSLFYIQNNLANSRLTVIISKKSVKSAVQRKLIKRKFREAFNLVFKDDLKHHFDFALIIKTPIYNFTKIKNDLVDLLNFFFKYNS